MRLSQIVCALVAMGPIMATGEDLALLAYKQKIDLEIAGYKKTIAELQAQVTFLTDGNKTCVDSFNEFKRKIEIDINNYNNNIGLCKKTFDELNVEYGKCKQSVIDLKVQFESQAGDFNIQIGKFKDQFDQLNIEYGKCKTSFGDFQIKYQTDINIANNNVIECKRGFDQLNIQFNTCQKSITEIKNDFQVKFDGFVSQIGDFKIQITNLNTQLTQCSSSSGDIKVQFELKINQLNTIILDLKASIAKYEGDYQTCQRTIDDLRRTNNALTADLNACKDGQVKFTDIIKRLESDVAKLTGQVSSLTVSLEKCRTELAGCSKVDEKEYKRVLALVTKYQTLLAHCRRTVKLIISSRADFKKYLIEISAFIDNMNLKTIKGDIGAKLTWCMTDRADFKKRIVAFGLSFDAFSDLIDSYLKDNNDDTDLDYDNIKITFSDYDGCVAGFKSIFQQFTSVTNDLRVTVNSLNICNNKLKEFGVSLIGSARPE